MKKNASLTSSCNPSCKGSHFHFIVKFLYRKTGFLPEIFLRGKSVVMQIFLLFSDHILGGDKSLWGRGKLLKCGCPLKARKTLVRYFDGSKPSCIGVLNFYFTFSHQKMIFSFIINEF